LCFICCALVKTPGRIKHATDTSKSLRPSQKTKIQNTVFKLMLSTGNPWTVSLHSLFLSTFRFTQQSWLSAQIQKVSLQSSLCVQMSQHTSLLQGISAYVHRDDAYTREFSLYRFLALLTKPEGTASSAVTQPRGSTATAMHSRDHFLLSD